MKKLFMFAFALSLGFGSILANKNNLADYINQSKIFDILKCDTISIQYFATENQFKFIQPDTVWIKKVKRPKENKHYKLQWFQLLEEENEDLSKDTLNFVFNDFVYHESEGKIELYLYDLQLKRGIVFTPNRTIEIKSKSVEQEIFSLLKDSVVYYKDSKSLSFKTDDEFYNSTQLDSCQYKISLTPFSKANFISILYSLKFNNNINGYLSDGKICLEDDNLEIITHEEFLSHNSQVQENIKKDSIVRLARVFCEEAICNDQEYAFEGDTMAIINFFKEEEYPWSDDSLEYFTAYAYGKEYKIKYVDAWEQKKEDIVQFIDTMDFDFLNKRRLIGSQRRKEVAKIWDKKNDSILQNDSVRDKNVVWAILDDISYAFLQQIDEYGYRINESADKPISGQKVPIFYYGQAGNLISAWWFIFKGKYFAIDANAYSKIKFENEEDRLYLMRSGRRNFEQRMLLAQIEDLATQFEEILKKEVEKDKKKKSLIQKKIFLLSQNNAYGNYDWCGIKPRFLNCYSKTIKYIYCDVVPYNQFGDIEDDDYGNYKKEIRCVGPLESGEVASWRFDEIFKNESGIIKSFRITNIKIVFVDNSTIIYKGWENVRKHYEYVDDL